MGATKYYEFSQNNSGGSFSVDNKLCHRLFIEAHSADEANRIAKDMGVYFDGCSEGIDCNCCGDRWHEADESDAVDLQAMSKSYRIKFDDVKGYAQHLANEYGWTKPDARVLHLNGAIDDIFTQDNP